MNDALTTAGKVARAISEITETLLLGARVHRHREVGDADEEGDRDPPITTSVRAAFLPCGGRNAPTPFEIDSTPVSAAAPDANACRTTNTPTRRRRPRVGFGHVRLRARPGRALADAGPDHHVHDGDERVGGEREEHARLADAAQVDDREQHDEERARARPCAPRATARPR